MKKLILIFLCIPFTGKMCFSQNNIPIEDLKKAADVLETNYKKNKADYDAFYIQAVNNLDTNKSSIKYKSQVYAINNFVDAMAETRVRGDWENSYALNDLTKAKTKYYYDLQNYDPQIDGVQKLKPAWELKTD